MELKDVILSTLAEMEEELPEEIEKEKSPATVQNTQSVEKESPSPVQEADTVTNELLFLNAIRERLLVLFEGFQAPNNANIEAKIDMTLNFLEYTLATIDARVEKLEKGNVK